MTIRIVCWTQNQLQHSISVCFSSWTGSKVHRDSFLCSKAN